MLAPGPAEDQQPVDDDHGLGLGAGDFSVLDEDLLADLGGSILGERSPVVPQPQGPPTEPVEEAVSPPTDARPEATVSLAGQVSRASEDLTSKVPTSTNPSVTNGAFAGGRGGPGSDETRRQDRTPPPPQGV